MDRRSFLGLAAGALSLSQMAGTARGNLEGKKGLRLSITWGMLGRMPVVEAMALLSRLGWLEKLNAMKTQPDGAGLSALA